LISDMGDLLEVARVQARNAAVCPDPMARGWQACSP